ncbi:hypothetical protein CLIB1423_01S01112 [[Candida] railenensis]|uniref:Nucleoporin n=1 Tax=[Candida] railenensis TaxID=45579 RepID=A0A9P0QJ37_9ASCO|nr:hypothetical protein CLIB1423_01S01112 [[Candida] railenensis]
MSDSGNRSLSPRSTSGPTSSERGSDSFSKNGGTIGRVLNFFRKRSHEDSKQAEQQQSGSNTQQLRRANPVPQSEKKDYKDWKTMLSIANEPLNNSFEATKKRRMSTIQASKTAAMNTGSIPRSASIVEPANEGGLFSSIGGSLLNGAGNGTDDVGTNFGAAGIGASGMPGGYLTFFNARQAQRDSLNDLEQRRRSIIDRDVHYYAIETPERILEEPTENDKSDKDYGELVDSDQPASRLISPMDGVLVHPPNHIHSQLQTEHGSEAENNDDEIHNNEIVKVDQTQQGEGNLPLIIEHEFAPLYRDVNGNLVRPPFINLDPRERYQLLQLKKSVEASESLQNRIKYMTNPLETHSKRIPQTNKVETSTQTHDLNSLSNSLNFVRKRRIERDVVSDEPRTKKTKNTNGYFVCDFDYEVAEEPPKKKKSSSNLQGYLGEVSTPSIKDKLPKEEGAKSTSQRFGLDDLFSGKKSREDVKLDSEYLANSKYREKKATVENVASEMPKSSPSLFTTKTPPASSSGTASAPIETKTLFGASSSTGGSAPAPPLPSFSFAKKSSSEEQDDPKRKRSLRDFDESSKPKPTFSFGAASEASKSTSGNSKPALNFGSKSTELKFNSPAITSDVKEDHKISEAVPQKQTFSFGVPDKKDETKVEFSFGSKTTEKKDDVPKLNFSFGAAPGESSEKKDDTSIPKPLFSFGAPSANADKKTDVQNPAFSLGGTTASTEKKDDLPKPSFSFSVEEKKEDSVKPAFSFGLDKKSESTSTDKGTSQLKGGERGDTKAAFSFGSSIAPKEGTSSPSPNFSFGSSTAPVSTEKNNETPKPAFSFGETKNAPTKPAFSFGAESSASSVTPTSSDKKNDNVPVFNFGTTVKPASPFTFGSSNTAQNTTGNISTDQASKPAFSFGANSQQQKPALPLTTPNQVGAGVNPKASSQSPAPFSFSSNGPGASPQVETPKPISTAFSFGNNISNGSNGFGGGSTFNVSTPLNDKTLGGGLAQSSQQQQISQPFSFGQPNSGVSSSQQFAFGTGAPVGTAVSNPNSREVSPAFNFQKSGASSSPNLNVGFQHQTPIQPSLVPNINFASGGSASADPSAIFSSTTPPPTTGTPPLVRGGRRIALPRSRRR